MERSTVCRPAARLALLCLCWAALAATEVEFEGRKVIYAAPEKRPAVAVLIWFHGTGASPAVEAGWFRGQGLVARGLAVAAPPARLGWNEETDRFYAHRLGRELRRRLRLEPSQVIIGGSGTGAAFAMRLATDYQDSLCTAAILVRGGLGGRWRAAESDPPVFFGIYANANDTVVPIASMRTLERRLETSGYPTHFVSALDGQSWGTELVELVEAVCAARTITLGPARPLPAPEHPPAAESAVPAE